MERGFRDPSGADINDIFLEKVDKATQNDIDEMENDTRFTTCRSVVTLIGKKYLSNPVKKHKHTTSDLSDFKRSTIADAKMGQNQNAYINAPTFKYILDTSIRNLESRHSQDVYNIHRDMSLFQKKSDFASVLETSEGSSTRYVNAKNGLFAYSSIFSKLGHKHSAIDIIDFQKSVENVTKDNINKSEVSVDSAPSKIVKRNVNGDIYTRCFRSIIPDQNSISGALAFREKNVGENAVKFCSDINKIKKWLGIGEWDLQHVASRTGTGYWDIPNLELYKPVLILLESSRYGSTPECKFSIVQGTDFDSENYSKYFRMKNTCSIIIPTSYVVELKINRLYGTLRVFQ